jgi:hypothetical protein
MDTINLDLIAFASGLALAVNLVGGVIFAVVIRRLWLAAERTTQAPRATQTNGPTSTAYSCLAL